ncbi:MAG: hypothetical protein ACYS8L_03095 [Planctomycetota bacterium]|jgi:hypothetical protein
MNAGGMTLEVAGRQIIVNPSDEDIRAALAGFDAAAGDAFLILSSDDMTYMQAGGDRNVGFDLEYQEGSMDQHFRATRNDIPLTEVLQVLIEYRDGRTEWKGRFDFERITW